MSGGMGGSIVVGCWWCEDGCVEGGNDGCLLSGGEGVRGGIVFTFFLVGLVGRGPRVL